MSTAAPPALPDIAGEACVHALAPHASCRSCVDACPAAALLLDDEGLSLDTSRCTGCGLCVPACPRAAIGLARPLTVIHAGRESATAFATCARAPGSDALAMACLHALGPRDLDALADQGVSRLEALAGDCASCANSAASSGLPRAAAAHVAVRASRGLPALSVALPEAAAFRRALARAREDEDRVDQSRRRLFGALVAPAAPALPAQQAPRAYWTPAIEPARCTGCDACARICPDGALTLERGAITRYIIDPAACSGCRLCLDVCDSQAMGLTPLGPALVSAVMLDAFRCRACGVTAHQPRREAAVPAGLCRICASTGHHKKLFQVLSER